MSRYLTNNAFALLTAGSTLVWLSAWVTGLCLDPGSWPVRYTLFGIGFLVSAHVVLVWMWQLASQHRTAAHYLEALARLDPSDSVVDNGKPDLPPLPSNNPWHVAATALTELILDAQCRAQNAEDGRTALEVRANRMEALYGQIQSILDGLTEPIIAINNLDEVVLANNSAQALFDFDLTKTEQHAADQLLRCDTLMELLTETRHRTGSKRRTGELQLQNDDEGHWYRVTASGVPGLGDPTDDSHEVHGAVAVLRDISATKTIQKRHAEFVSTVSHEMKAPLAGIKAYVELLADGDAEDEATSEQFLTVINSQADRLQRLIDNLLNLARIEAGVVCVSKNPRSLNEILDEAIRVTALAAEAKQIDIQSDLSPMYLGVLVDRDLMLQAAINLLSNAIKYTAEGGRVSLRSRMRGSEAVFEVEDTGVGLSKEDCERVFDKFYRVNKNRDMAEGTGLGLPLARHIVEDVHGGRLGVSSELGVGSTFAVSLPSAAQMT